MAAQFSSSPQLPVLRPSKVFLIECSVSSGDDVRAIPRDGVVGIVRIAAAVPGSRDIASRDIASSLLPVEPAVHSPVTGFASST
jgi:hypothetical protein